MMSPQRKRNRDGGFVSCSYEYVLLYSPRPRPLSESKSLSASCAARSRDVRPVSPMLHAQRVIQHDEHLPPAPGRPVPLKVELAEMEEGRPATAGS